MKKIFIVCIVILLIGVSVYTATQVFGDTFIGVSLFGRNSSLDDGLVGHWTFDGRYMDNDVTDSSGEGNDGALILGASGNTATTTAIGRIGQALEFDGVDDQVSINSVFGLGNTNLSIAAWVHLDSTSEGGAFVKIGNETGGAGNNNGFGIGVGSSSFDNTGNDLVLLYEDIRWIDTSDAIGTGWHHVVMTINNSGVPEWFIDGVSGGTSAGSNGVAPTLGATKIGGYTALGGGERFADAAIDDVRIYNRALSADEIERLYQLGAGTKVGVPPSGGTLAGEFSGLVGHWTFDGKDLVSNVADVSGNGNHGSLILGASGNIATTTTIGRIGQALEFDGTDDYITVLDDNSLDLPTAWTLSAWAIIDAFPGSVDNWRTFISKGNNTETAGQNHNYWLGIENDLFGSGVAVLTGFETSSGSNVVARTTSLPSTGEWHHFVGSFNTNTNKLNLYIDGVLVQSDTETSEPQGNSTANLTIGRPTANGVPSFDEYFNGKLDDIRIYNRALLPSEIQRLYDTGR